MALQVGLSIQSTIENLELVQLVLEEAMTRLEVGGKVSYEVSMAVREAVANAIEHGNRSEPDKKVHVELDLLKELELDQNRILVRAAYTNRFHADRLRFTGDLWLSAVKQREEDPDAGKFVIVSPAPDRIRVLQPEW